MSGVGTVEPVELGPIRWREGDSFDLQLTLHVKLGRDPFNWVKVEREAKEKVRRRFREAREALHQGRPR